MKERRTRRRKLLLPAATAFTALIFVILAVPMILEGCRSTQAEVKPEKTELELWYYWDVSDARQCLETLVEKFNSENEKLEIRLKYVPDEDFKKTLALAVADGTMPDLAIVDSADVQYYSSMGTLKDLTDCVDEEEYLEWALAGCRNEDGRYVGLPLGLNCLTFYYNTDILERANVKPPETLDEFLKAAKQVSSDSVYGCAFPSLQSAESIYCFLPVLWAMGGSMENLASEESARAFDFIHQLAADGSMSLSSVNMTLTDITREFANEKLAMIFAMSGSEKLIQEINPDIHFQVAELPNGKPPVSVIGGETLIVTSQTHAEEAEEFVRFMAEPEQIRKYLCGGGYLSPRKDVLEWQVSQDYSKQKYLTYLQNARSREFSPYWPSASLLIADVINQMILQENPPDALVQLAEEISRLQEEQNEKE